MSNKYRVTVRYISKSYRECAVRLWVKKAKDVYSAFDIANARVRKRKNVMTITGGDAS